MFDGVPAKGAMQDTLGKGEGIDYQKRRPRGKRGISNKLFIACVAGPLSDIEDDDEKM